MSKTREGVLLLVISALVGAGLEWLHLPAALLLGPMAAAVALAAMEARPHVPTFAFQAAQAVIGSARASRATSCATRPASCRISRSRSAC